MVPLNSKTASHTIEVMKNSSYVMNRNTLVNGHQVTCQLVYQFSLLVC